MSATGRLKDSPEFDQESLPLLLLLVLGLVLGLVGWLPFRAAPSVDVISHQYRWLAEPDRPAGVYRLPEPLSADATAVSSSSSMMANWGEAGPPYLAIFTFQPIAVNRADARTLRFLPGIGPTLSRRIVDYRTAHGPFRDPEELLLVHGIGPKTLAALHPLITID
ncbi:ComEA family DNA-binding protein [Desulfurivibrio dismutans]|uniref:ComEA family DNA-binding protein n=1 Tax=Desulfurivibrio dismutans TaxID=1398908 RepID=UPI0023DA95DF|nr:helix-hairpin-helix domain-containing protein [Desulfurivibrio alkaliphilus]MDF1615025.1 helix-hairpin-helix domain-containing protein [Desulfurivibrio alkaliphilus]